MELRLEGLTVLTEVGSGAFVTTPLIAALGGAEMVFAVTRSSNYGSAEEVINYGLEWADRLGVADRIVFSSKPAEYFAASSQIVTNLAHVRPISNALIAALPKEAVIALMWEPWEFRPSDLDLNACQANDVLVLATRETDGRVQTFGYVGALAAKLLFESGIEVVGSSVGVVGSDPFGASIESLLSRMGCSVDRLRLGPGKYSDLDKEFGPRVESLDALVVVEHRRDEELVGFKGGINPHRLLISNTRLVHICGNVDYSGLERCLVFPPSSKGVKVGFMTVTTGYLGPRPVIDLHTAGLKGAEVAVRARRAGRGSAAALKAAISTGLALELNLSNLDSHNVQAKNASGVGLSP